MSQKDVYRYAEAKRKERSIDRKKARKAKDAAMGRKWTRVFLE